MNKTLEKQYADYINLLKSKKSKGYAMPNGWNNLATTTTAATSRHYYEYYNGYGIETPKVKYLQLGSFNLAIKNYSNKLFRTSKVNFSFTTSDKGSKLNVACYYDDVEFTSLNELKDYINYLKTTYNELKVVEKKLNINKDF
jgi:hypothetical protein